MKPISFRMFTALLISIYFAGTGLAQEAPPEKEMAEAGWQLAALEALALSHAPELAAARAETEAAQKGVTVARLGWLPQLSTRIAYEDNAKIANVLTFSEPEPYDLWSSALIGEWAVFDGFRRHFQLDLATAEEAVAFWRERESRQSLLQELASAFFDAADARQSLDDLSPLIARARERLEAQQEQLAAGTLSRITLSRIRQDLAHLEKQRLTARYAQEMAESRMARLLATEEGFWDYREHYEAPPVKVLPLDLLSKRDIPAVERARADAAAAEAKTGLARSRFSPQVKLNGSVGYRSLSRFATQEQNQEYSFGVSLTWDFTDAGTQIVRVAQLQAEERAATSRLELARARHLQTVATAQLEKMQAEEMLELQTELAAMALRRLNDVKQSYEARTVTRDDLLAAQQELASAQMELRRAQMQVSRQTYLLWLTAGQPPLAALARSTADSSTKRSALHDIEHP